MKVALIGYGKMGQLLEKQLLERGDDVLVVMDPFYPIVGQGGYIASDAVVYTSLEEALNGSEENGEKSHTLKNVDVAMEFSGPVTAPENILFLVKEKIPVVSGTTGWYSELPEITQAVKNSNSSMLWSANFSLGINLFYRIIEHAAKLMNPFPEYDVAGLEAHHNKKADSPSGTAKTLIEHVLTNMPRKKKAVFDILNRPPADDELHYASLRLGSMPGTHSLVFDSPTDTIEITHVARSREGFVSGALLAAEWLVQKSRNGVFTMDDVLADILK
jgi:4-hydroxy-tetrahydrodipicolinate reductase